MTLLHAPRIRYLARRALTLTICSAAIGAQAADWSDALKAHIERIDRETPGELGVYIKRLDNGEVFSYRADKIWYLSSSAKLPVAIALLQEVDEKKRSLTDKAVLQDTDKVDGSGNVVWQKTGMSFDLGTLLQRMLMVSDNTAANMLIRTLGEDTLNRRAQEYFGPGALTRITDFAQVRYDVYSEMHPAARQLTNLQLVQIAGAPMGPKRVQAVARALGVVPSALQVGTMDAAYDRYYARQINSATLEGYGAMLEKLVRGQLLSPASQRRLYTDMKFDTYDAYRLEAGLPRTVRFVHKTGTQHRRACHMGVIDPQDNGARAIVVATCAQNLDEHKEGGRAFEQIGRAITQTLLGGR